MPRPVTHEGEQSVKHRVGGGRPAPAFGPKITSGFAEFLQRQRMLVIGAPDAEGAVWAGIVTGEAEFVRTRGDSTIATDGLPVVGDPLREAFDTERDCGTIAIDPLHSRRIRANGRARRDRDGLVLVTEQVLRNCPKYIQQRQLVTDAAPERRPTRGLVTTELSEQQQDWIIGADTFFIATHSPVHGADASHRGGAPGFVTVAGNRLLSWPDYVGNSFYMTLGNLELNPACGLLFVDWSRGHTLHLTGRAQVDWQRCAAPGAKRTIDFYVDRVVQVDHATVLRWQFLAPSSYNPTPPEEQQLVPEEWSRK
ncbi:hypothetical protein DFQ14_12514 [Halopolyspora algeriensis]|uniref:Uncharacterized protein n=1 Tax=Halopolyspora algeriensis TaxID=1500506 RepID=A0A368V959_9ACTN|nr:pyridoxamine 5'-phosphate oxidase family protein [Halopolyspora algeriensis]RCW37658.1 hypothetical protein DFQ14_12514 [Halopolyspora algeriensis]TQM53808.1 hypothetical protein FHU43_1977 [Halopolyspora algeriensis]